MAGQAGSAAIPARRGPAPGIGRLAGLPVALLVLCVLVAAMAGGLLRAGLTLPDVAAGAIGSAALHHGGLMLSALFGTAITLERAVALRLRWVFLAPAAALAGGLGLVHGNPPAAALLLTGAAAVMVPASWIVVRRQPAAHTGLLLVAVLGWLGGNLLFAAVAWAPRGLVLPASFASGTLALWFSFPILTVAAERLEMTRVMRRPPAVERALVVICAGVLLGALLSPWLARAGGAVFGIALMLLAVWLGLFDVARRTVRGSGLAAYMAWCLLCGYAWLGLGGLAWWGTAWGCPGRDLMLHALGLGFLFSMVMGHAPVILPAVTGWRVEFGARFYLPLVALHLSLALRLFGGLQDSGLRLTGALLNAAALVLFVLTLASAVRLGAARKPKVGLA